MNTRASKNQKSFHDMIRQVIEACADCDTCRFLMDDSCLFFPELYRLFDQEKQSGQALTDNQLQRLTDMCTVCGLCPCPDIRADIMEAKAARVRENGMPLGVRLLADAENTGKYAGCLPGLANTLLAITPAASAAKRLAGIAQARKLPGIPNRNFFVLARRKGLTRMPAQSPKAAYFAGCTAGYLFPVVGLAAVDVLEQNGIQVYVPPQQCCGMPTLAEGAQRLTRMRVRKNIKTLLDAAASGCDLVCSCPTCGFFMKILLKEGAFYSGAYQETAGAGAHEIRIPDEKTGGGKHTSVQKSMYGKILKDNPCFSGIDPMARIDLSQRLVDLGGYLWNLHQQDRLNTDLGHVTDRMVYFAPCHQREQNIGSPYQNLLALIPGIDLERVGGAMDCCGMGGSLGFKKSFHADSLRLGQQLADKIRGASPKAVVTECLSCRLQFRHLMPELSVFHPLEILQRAYEKNNVRHEGCFVTARLKS